MKQVFYRAQLDCGDLYKVEHVETEDYEYQMMYDMSDYLEFWPNGGDFEAFTTDCNGTQCKFRDGADRRKYERHLWKMESILNYEKNFMHSIPWSKWKKIDEFESKFTR